MFNWNKVIIFGSIIINVTVFVAWAVTHKKKNFVVGKPLSYITGKSR